MGDGGGRDVAGVAGLLWIKDLDCHDGKGPGGTSRILVEDLSKEQEQGSRILGEHLSKEQEGNWDFKEQEQGSNWDPRTYISLNAATDWGDIKAGTDLFSSDLKLKEYKSNLIKVILIFFYYGHIGPSHSLCGRWPYFSGQMKREQRRKWEMSLNS